MTLQDRQFPVSRLHSPVLLLVSSVNSPRIRRGGYDFEALTPGEYTLVVEGANFASYTVKEIVVTIGSSIALDAHLRLKTAEQSVTVTAEAAGAVDTSTAGVTQLLNEKSVENLPLEGRDYRDLAQLTPSVSVVPGLRGGLRLGGQQSDYSGLVIDGADSTNNFFGENFGSLETKNLTVPLEAVQEFQVVVNGFAPELAAPRGACSTWSLSPALTTSTAKLTSIIVEVA